MEPLKQLAVVADSANPLFVDNGDDGNNDNNDGAKRTTGTALPSNKQVRTTTQENDLQAGTTVHQDSLDLEKQQQEDESVPGTLIFFINSKFEGRYFEFVEYFDDHICYMRNFSVDAFSVKNNITAQDDRKLLSSLVALLQGNSRKAENVPTKWQDIVDVYLGVRGSNAEKRGSESARSSGERVVKRRRKRKEIEVSSMETCTTTDKDASSSLGRNDQSDESSDSNSNEDNETSSVNGNDDDDDDDDNDNLPSTKKRGKKGLRLEGSLDHLVKKGFQGDFTRFFDCILDEMRAPTFSFSGFTRQRGVPKARETLRNIACYLKGEPTKQFVGEAWKKRVQAYLQTKERHKGSEGTCIPSDNSDTPANVSTAEQYNKDILMSQKRGRMRGREGALDKFVMNELEGNFFKFLELVEQEMKLPKFTPTAFVRKYRVFGGRETLRHIVSHLKEEFTSSDRLLAQMWKDRIHVYKKSKDTDGGEGQGSSKSADSEKCSVLVEDGCQTVEAV